MFLHYTSLGRILKVINSKVCKSILGKAQSQIGTGSIGPHKESGEVEKSYFQWLHICNLF